MTDFFQSEHSSEGLSSFALHHRTCEIPNHLRIPGTMNVFDQSEGMVTHQNAHQFYFLDIVATRAQVVETSVTNNSPSQDSNHPDDLNSYTVYVLGHIYILSPS